MSGAARDYAVSDQVLTAHLDGEAIVLNLDTKQYYQLNSSAARIWSGLERGLDDDALVAELCDIFDVSPEVAAAEIPRMIQRWVELGLVVARSGSRPDPVR
ncbi:MAG TPA: PqqD family protein [Longimicrobiales bacterium]|nr:PqqD family protein [Longimicrobiales bacterium]